MKRLSIIIVNYRTPQLVIDCLRSLVPEVCTELNIRVTVVDNNSCDSSVPAIQHVLDVEQWWDWVDVLPLDRNLGFAGGNNAALQDMFRSSSILDYILLLNPDTVVRPGALRALVEFMERHPEVGIAGSRLEEPDGTPQCSAFRFPTLTSELDRGLRLGLVSRLLHHQVVAPPVRNEAHATDWVAGASMLVRFGVFQDVGLLDEHFFLYFEEVDFCLRARRAGWACWHVPSSRVVHLVGQSSGITDTKRPSQRVPRYWFDSRRRFFHKHYGWFYLQSANLTWALAFGLWRLRRLIQYKPDNDPPLLLWDFLRFNLLGAIGFVKGGQ